MSKIEFLFKTRIHYPMKAIIIKIFSPFWKKKYQIKEIPFCMEIISIKDWKEELNTQWLFENEDKLDELEEI